MIWTCGNRSFPDRSPKFSIKLVHNRSNIEFILQVNRFTNAVHWVEILSYDSCSTGCYRVTLLLLQPRCLVFFPGWNVILPWEGMMYLQDRWPSRWWFSCRASTGRWPKCAPKLLSPKIIHFIDTCLHFIQKVNLIKHCFLFNWLEVIPELLTCLLDLFFNSFPPILEIFCFDFLYWFCEI